MFNFLKEKIKKVYASFTTKALELFSSSLVDEKFLLDLEHLLLTSDVGTATTAKIMTTLRDEVKQNAALDGLGIKASLKKQLISLCNSAQSTEKLPRILLLVGINGSGKTTFAARCANLLTKTGKKVLLVAGDTFRAAATHQLEQWAKAIHVEVFIGKSDQDPASVIFDACHKFSEEHFDHLIIDTAGRLQTKINLMKEIEKIRKIIARKLPGETITTWLTIDSMLGQNSFAQAKIFNEVTSLNGLILTKLDGTGKGGIIFSITKELALPVVYVTFGEKLDDIKVFNSEEYVSNLLGS